ncbi:RAxF-45 family protein [Filobacillus milosensis]
MNSIINYECRVLIHDSVAQGTSVSIFSNRI